MARRGESRTRRKARDAGDLVSNDGLLLRDSFRMFRKALQRRLGDSAGISVAHYWVLRTLYIEDGLTPIELGSRLGIEKPGISSLIQSMEKQGLIRRQRNVEDRRKLNLFLTEDGEKMRDAVLGCAREVNARASGTIPRRELDRMRRVIRLMMANLASAYELDTDEA